jgi:undecaprenyl-diphosphatase
MLDRVMRAITHMGDGYLWWLIGGLLLLYGEGGGRVTVQLTLAFSIELTAYKVVKRAAARRRPFVELPLVTCLVVPPDEFSFPSGHTAAAFVMAVVVGTAYPVFFPFLSALALLIGVSRVYLGVHYPTDIVAGVGLGTISAMIAISAV